MLELGFGLAVRVIAVVVHRGQLACLAHLRSCAVTVQMPDLAPSAALGSSVMHAQIYSSQKLAPTKGRDVVFHQGVSTTSKSVNNKNKNKKVLVLYNIMLFQEQK